MVFAAIAKAAKFGLGMAKKAGSKRQEYGIGIGEADVPSNAPMATQAVHGLMGRRKKKRPAAGTEYMGSGKNDYVEGGVDE